MRHIDAGTALRPFVEVVRSVRADTFTSSTTTLCRSPIR